jgi:redox-sensing transcriptional repressor
MMQRAALFRLESYLTWIQELKLTGRTTVTSEELATVVGISDSRVRQDLIQLHIAGKPRSGYNVSELEILIYSALDLLSEKGMALVGFGNLGRALVHSALWEHAGFLLKAIFDNDQSITGTPIDGLTVHHIRELPGVVKSESIVCACLTVPADAAQSVTDLLVSAGIRGIWNFTPTKLQTPQSIIVENQRLEQGLMTLSYLLKTPRQLPHNSSGAVKEDIHK